MSFPVVLKGRVLYLTVRLWFQCKATLAFKDSHVITLALVLLT